MLNFSVDCMKQFSNAISLLRILENNKADFKSTPTMFSIIISKPSPSPSLVSLQIIPQFFTKYSCDQTHYIKFNIANFYTNILNNQRIGSSFLGFSLAQTQRHVALKFKNPGQGFSKVVKESTSVPTQQMDVPKIDYSSFASFELEDFRRIVRMADFAHVSYAQVTLTHSYIRFSVGHHRIVLSKEKNEECIIGGVNEGDQIKSAIFVAPVEFFNNLGSERLWLFKSIDSNRIILTAPMGLYLQILSYFPKS